MRYIKLSFKYLIKNILFLFLLSLIPSIFMGSLLSPFKFFEFINNYSSITITGFADIFYSIFDISWLKILFYLITFALLAVTISFVIGEIENHFRSGKKNFKGYKNYINNNIMVVISNIIIFSVINFILLFLYTTLVYLFHFLIVGLNVSANAGCIVIAIILGAIYFCLMAIIGLVLMLNVPNMLYNGYNFKQSMSNSINLLSKNFIGLILAYLLPFAIIIPLISIFNFSSIALHIINVICLIISMMYYSSFAMTAYYDLSGLSRYDERKYYNIK